MTVTIIGCGYIGKKLAQKLQQPDVFVYGYVSSETSQAECDALNIPCDILDLDAPIDGIDLTDRSVIYFAPPPKSGRIDPRMKHFLDSAEHQRPVKIVLISTTGVYGDCKGDWIDETTPLNPKVDRAYRRADAERQCQNYCTKYNIPLIILRVAGIYGPDKIPVARIKSGNPIVNMKDSPITNRIHAIDLVNICEAALLKQDITGVYNVTDGHPGTMYDYFTGVAKALNLPAPPAISLEEAKHLLSDGMLSYMAESRRIDNSKLISTFAITLQYPRLKDGLKNIVEKH